jgi:hypothetical protein
MERIVGLPAGRVLELVQARKQRLAALEKANPVQGRAAR